MGQKRVDRIVDTTSSVGGALSVNVVTENVTGLIWVAQATVVDSLADIAAYMYDEPNSNGVGPGILTPIELGSTAPYGSVVAGVPFVLMMGGGPKVGDACPGFFARGPLPRRLQFRGTAGLTGTLRFTIYSVKC